MCICVSVCACMHLYVTGNVPTTILGWGLEFTRQEVVTSFPYVGFWDQALVFVFDEPSCQLTIFSLLLHIFSDAFRSLQV